mmetsp:Transcript_47806/g.86147  ORF Transcript_47806/g.86147 Transcript_47806/m.86147 type:complete len:217 (-) Transcript_47806:413-1063(-)
MADTAKPLPVLAASSTSLTFCIIGLHIARKLSRSMLLLKSSSSMRHSQETAASEFAERTFLVFPTASSSLKHAFLLERTSQPVFFLNCSANARIRHSSMSRPPTLSDRSQSTVSFPLMNCTMDTVKRAWPIWQKATVEGFSASNVVLLKKPYSRAVAACSFITLSTFSLAMAAASSRAVRWKSEKYDGTPITASATLSWHQASAIFFNLVRNIAVT